MSGLIPDFIGIGSGKSGSTWFFTNLVKHPELFDRNPKEINYFSDHYKNKDLQWYYSHFADSDGLITGEFSVSYMSTDGSAKRIHDALPNVKLIAVLRRPQDRIFSDYLHSIRKGDINPETTFSEYISDENQLTVAKYHDQLAPYFDLFPHENIKVFLYEELVANPADPFREIYAWLGVKDADFLPGDIDQKVNEARVYRMLWLENLITRTSRALNSMGFTKLVEAIKRLGVVDFLRNLNKDSASEVPTISHEDDKVLAEYYKEQNSNLSALLGISLETWETRA